MRRSQYTGNLNFTSVTKAENNYMITRLDPFHDRTYEPTGGMGSAPTVIRQYTRTVNISAPSGGTTNWSCCVGTMPDGVPLLPETTGSATGQCVRYLRAWANGVANSLRFELNATGNYGANNAMVYYGAASPESALGISYPLCPVFAIASSQTSFQSSTQVDVTNPAAPVFLPAGSSSIPIGVCQFGEDCYTDGPTKLVSVAYEIHMTSSDLYNQGTLTVARVPQALQSCPVKFFSSATANVITAATVSTVLPSNSADLILYQGAKQWPAKYGVYAVAPPICGNSDFDPSPFVSHATRTRSWQAQLSAPAAVSAISSLTSTRDGNQFLASTEHFDTVMTIVEGLHPQSTLQVVVKLTYETIPSDSDILRPLARMPQPKRSNMEDLIYEIGSKMEPFCMVSENANANFFKKIAAVAKTVIKSPVTAAIYNQVMAAVPKATHEKVLAAGRAATLLAAPQVPKAQRTAAINELVSTAAAINSRYRKKKKQGGAKNGAQPAPVKQVRQLMIKG